MPKSICLNMIVKDEMNTIKRALDSIKPFISYWVIVDTGSTDDTKKIIQDTLSGIPGELHEKPWVNFAYNRNEALRLAKGKSDYILFLDADETFEFPPNFVFPELDQDSYLIVNDGPEIRCWKTQLVKSELDWAWEGALHEAIKFYPGRSQGKILDVKRVVRGDGARSRNPQTLFKDIEILKSLLEKEPGNARYQFYLAKTYHAVNDLQHALEAFEKRILLQGDPLEVFWSLLQMGIICEALKMPSNIIMESYRLASKIVPTRAEPYFYLSRFYMNQKFFFAAYLAARKGITLPEPVDSMFVYHWIYDYGLLIQFATCAFLLKRFQEARSVFLLLLESKTLPHEARRWVETQLGEVDKIIHNPQSLRKMGV